MPDASAGGAEEGGNVPVGGAEVSAPPDASSRGGGNSMLMAAARSFFFHKFTFDLFERDLSYTSGKMALGIGKMAFQIQVGYSLRTGRSAYRWQISGSGAKSLSPGRGARKKYVRHVSLECTVSAIAMFMRVRERERERRSWVSCDAPAAEMRGECRPNLQPFRSRARVYRCRCRIQSGRSVVWAASSFARTTPSSTRIPALLAARGLASRRCTSSIRGL